jgi:hypothetical protein
MARSWGPGSGAVAATASLPPSCSANVVSSIETTSMPSIVSMAVRTANCWSRPPQAITSRRSRVGSVSMLRTSAPMAHTAASRCAIPPSWA